MAGKFSFVTLYDGRHLVVDREKGIKMQQVLDCKIEPENQAQADFVLNIKSIHPKTLTSPVTPKQVQEQYWNDLDAKDAQTSPEVATEHLTHEGIYQSMDSAVPNGDR